MCLQMTNHQHCKEPWTNHYLGTSQSLALPPNQGQTNCSAAWITTLVLRCAMARQWVKRNQASAQFLHKQFPPFLTCSHSLPILYNEWLYRTDTICEFGQRGALIARLVQAQSVMLHQVLVGLLDHFMSNYI